VFEAGRDYRRTELILEPGTDPAQGSAAQCIEHSTYDHGKRDDQCQHQERIAAAA
jgi:hypothetical protein